MPDKRFEVPELDWRGRVCLGRINVPTKTRRAIIPGGFSQLRPWTRRWGQKEGEGHAMMSWNLRGTPLKSLQESWDLLQAQGVDFLFVQELGGQGEAAAPWDRIPFTLRPAHQRSVLKTRAGRTPSCGSRATW